MSDVQSYPYETRLNILFKPLEVIEDKAFADACVYRWYNQTLREVNQSVVRLGVVEGEYHWHRTVERAPRQGFVVPMGAMHRPRAPERTVILMVENGGIVPTGD
jgi:hypothetical protein